ncbi:MAG: caspase domain-containing protein [Myxococcota bacterium]
MMNHLAVVWLATSLSISEPTDPSAPSVRRFAVLAASNDGGEGRARLRYAVSDAEAFAEVLTELGGVAAQDRFMVVEPKETELWEVLDRISDRLRLARGHTPRVELIFYYSGHSDEFGLLLGRERVGYGALRGRLTELPADVRIAVLDSCASGAFTRLKGGTERPPFLFDRSSSVEGTAVLTSSSETEAAQESDSIEASFFTHSLVSGLRGAADVSRDGRVTLNEAYQFAFHETLRRTEHSLGGPQHAAYDIELIGSGDLVMTDLSATSASLALPDTLSGRVFIRDPSGRLVVELLKAPGDPVALGLPPGPYEITVVQAPQLLVAAVSLAEGQVTELEPDALQVREGTVNASRGPEGLPEVRTVPFDVGIIPALSVSGMDPVHHNLALSLFWTHAYRLTGAALALGVSSVSEDMSGAQLSVAANTAGGLMEGSQLTVGANYAGEMRGFQGAVGSNVSGPSTGVQASVGANVAETFEGFQGAVGANVVRHAVGLQTAVGANITGSMKGAQMTVGFNVAEHSEGLQIGSINVASNHQGFQLGLVNVTGKTEGFQLGIVNIADRHEGESLGIISYSAERGIFRPWLGSSDARLAEAALKIGTGTLYTHFFVGTGSPQRAEAFSAGGGLGATFLVAPKLRLDVDLSTAPSSDNRQFQGAPDLVQSLRATLGFIATPWLTVVGGPAYRVLVDTGDLEGERSELVPGYAWRHGDRVFSWIGWSVGLEFLH